MERPNILINERTVNTHNLFKKCFISDDMAGTITSHMINSPINHIFYFPKFRKSINQLNIMNPSFDNILNRNYYTIPWRIT